MPNSIRVALSSAIAPRVDIAYQGRRIIRFGNQRYDRVLIKMRGRSSIKTSTNEVLKDY